MPRPELGVSTNQSDGEEISLRVWLVGAEEEQSVTWLWAELDEDSELLEGAPERGESDEPWPPEPWIADHGLWIGR